jgi:hypothetical protein
MAEDKVDNVEVFIDEDGACIEIPYVLFHQWQKLNHTSLRFVHLLNIAVPNAAVHIYDPVDRIHNLLRNAFYILNRKLSHTRW